MKVNIPLDFSHGFFNHLFRYGHWQVKKALAAGSTPMLEQRTLGSLPMLAIVCLKLQTSSHGRSAMMIG